VTVTLTNVRGRALTVPASVIVPRGATSAKFEAVPSIMASGSDTSTIRATTASSTSYAERNFTSHANYVQAVSVAPVAIAGDSVLVTVTVRNTAPPGGTLVTLGHTVVQTAGPEPIGTFSTNPLRIPAGSNSAAATLSLAKRWDNKTIIDVTASNGGTPALARLEIKGNQFVTWTWNAPCTRTGCEGYGELTLLNPAPAGGLVIALRSDNPQLIVPSSFSVAQGALTGRFSLNWGRVTTPANATIIGDLLGHTTEAAIPVQTGGRVATVVASPTSVISGNDVNFTVNLVSPAPTPGPVIVTYSWGSTQGTVDFPAAAQTQVVTLKAPYVAANTTSSASFRSDLLQVPASVEIVPIDLMALTILDTRPAGGEQARAAVALNGFAPKEGVSLALQSNMPAVAAVPPSVFVPGGSRFVEFLITTMRTPGTVTVQITATAPTGTTKTSSLIVNADATRISQ
jgi:hypothetical protein